MSDHYPTVEAYTADVERARAAYAADEAVRAGLCAICKRAQEGDRRNRRCQTCYRAGRREDYR